MHPIDIESTLKTMKIVIDTREQATQQAQERYASFGVPYERRKLNFGDYSAVFTIPDGSIFDLSGFCAIERKLSLDELCACYTHDRGRFTREFER
jgi:ERCC4-type nuclease